MSNLNSTLTQERLKEVLRYDPYTGNFYNLIYRGANAKVGQIAGGIDSGYVRIKIDGVLYRAHRLAWLYIYGAFPKHEIDHMDANKSNNRISNLRDIPKNENLQNQKTHHTNSKTKILGVSKNGSGFQAGISHEGKTLYLGTYKSQDIAKQVYLDAKRKLHPGSTL